MTKPIRVGLNIAGWAVAGAGLATGALAAVTAWSLNGRRPPWPPYTFTPFEVGAPTEELRFRTDDDVLLAGWWFDRPESELVVICCHGHRGNKSDMLGIGPGLWRAGHSVMLFDFRGCGDSEGGPQSLAHHEQRDLSAAIGLVRERRPGARIAVAGFSMGAATAILTAAVDERVDALVLDSPFATMSDLVASSYRRYRLPGQLLLTPADLANRARYGYGFGQVRPLDAVGLISPRPILLLHGTDDRVIPYEHAQQLVEAAAPGPIEFVTFEGVDHCGGYFEDRPGYIARVDDFLRRAIDSAPPA